MKSILPTSTRARFALILCITLLPVIGSTVLSYQREKQVLLAHIHEDAMCVTRMAAGAQELAINNARQLLTALGSILDREVQSRGRLLNNVHNENPVYAGIGLALADGTVVGTPGCRIPPNLVSGIGVTRGFAMDIQEDEEGRENALILSNYTHLDQMGSDAALFVVLDMKKMCGYSDLQLPRGAEYILVTENGTVLAAEPDAYHYSDRRPAIIEIMLTRNEGTAEADGLDGKKRLYAFRPLSSLADTGIYIAIGFPTSIYTEFDNVLSLDLLVLALSLLAGAIIWTLTDRTLIRKVDALVTMVRKLSGGEMRARTGLDHGRRGEVERIAEALDQMADVLEKRTNQLYSYQEQLRSMASELLLVEERERRRIATEMHDRIGQALAVSKMRLSALMKSGEEHIRADLAGIRKYIDQAIADTRSLIYKISSPILYELGLEAAIEWLAEQVREEHGIKCSFFDDGLEKPLDEDVRALLFQAVGELLVNVVKHADAGVIVISCGKDGEFVLVEVDDDGRGFDPFDNETRRGCPPGFGLFSIRERLSHVKGTFEIDSAPGMGTRIVMRAPLKRAR